MTTQSTVVIRPARNLAGSLRLPGDKSISHRYAMLGAMAQGATKLRNFSTGADCASTLACLQTLGVEWERRDGAVGVVGGAGRLRGGYSGPRPAVAPARLGFGLRQFRLDHAHAERDCCRTGVR